MTQIQIFKLKFPKEITKTDINNLNIIKEDKIFMILNRTSCDRRDIDILLNCFENTYLEFIKNYSILTIKNLKIIKNPNILYCVAVASLSIAAKSVFDEENRCSIVLHDLKKLHKNVEKYCDFDTFIFLERELFNIIRQECKKIPNRKPKMISTNNIESETYLNEQNQVFLLLSRNGHDILEHYAEKSQPGFLSEGFNYDCNHGMDLFIELYIQDACSKETIFDETEKYFDPVDIKKGFIYFFEVHTKAGEEFHQNQVHYFCLKYDDEPMISQAYGGVKGISIRYLTEDFIELFTKVLELDHTSLVKLFDIPKSHLMYTEGYYEIYYTYFLIPMRNLTLADLGRVFNRIEYIGGLEAINRL